MDNTLLELLQQRWGVHAIDAKTGISILEKIWNCGQSQVLVVPGDSQKISKTLGIVKEGKPENLVSTTKNQITPDVFDVLIEEVVSVSKVERKLIDLDTPLDEYGFDSIMFTRLALCLSERLNIELTPADLVENPTIEQLQNFLKNQESNDVFTLDIGQKNNSFFDNKIAPLESGKNRFTPHPWFDDIQRFRENLKGRISLNVDTPILSEHCINGEIILPGSGYLELVRAAAISILDCSHVQLTNVSWQQPLRLIAGKITEAELSFEKRGGDYTFRISKIDDVKCIFSQGVVTPLKSVPRLKSLNLDVLRKANAKVRSKEDIYSELRESGLEYGPMYQSIDTLYISEGEALTHLSLTDIDTDTFLLHPALLDGAFQSAIGATLDNSSRNQVRVPFFLKAVRQFDALPPRCWVHVQRTEQSSMHVEKFDITICDEYGNVVAEIDHFTVRPLKKTVNIDSKKGLPSGHATDFLAKNTKPFSVSSEEKNFHKKTSSERIAVIGVSGRFPESPDVETYWRNLREGADLVSEVSSDRWNWREYFDERKGIIGKTYSNWAGYAPGVLDYDPEFFRIREEDAQAMDAQHLLILELSQQLFDAAGYRSDEIAGKNVAVILGAASNDCAATESSNVSDNVAKNAVVLSIQNMMAARVSDFYDLRGESYTVDTACSSSLVAIHNACRALRLGECDMAIAGGVALLFDEAAHVLYSQASILSDEPRSYVFDRRAKGFVLGEGAGLVLLKRYDDAVTDGDQILAVVGGSAINNDGRTMGITTPNKKMQREVISKAIDNAQVDPRSIEYLEAHGTGTLIGDPIEIKAASQAFREFTNDLQFCAVGSVKTNMGHLLLASGIASFIKVVMMLRHRYIPKTLHCETPHPRFEFERSPFRPALQGETWETSFDRRRAGVSGFGFGGTNCHMIIEEFVPDKTAYIQRREPLPPTRFNRIRCWKPWDKKNQKNISNSTTEVLAEKKSMTYEELVDALQTGLIDVEEAIALELTIT